MESITRTHKKGQIHYEVIGNGTRAFPFVTDIKTLGEAIAIASSYPEVFKDGAATHVLEHMEGDSVSRVHSEQTKNHSCRYTRRWKVFSDGASAQIPIHFKRSSPCDFVDDLLGVPRENIERMSCDDEGTHTQLVSLIRAMEINGWQTSALQAEEALTEGVLPVEALAEI